MNRLSLRKAIVITSLIMLAAIVLQGIACAPKAPPPLPPAPPAGTIAVEPPKIDYAKVEEMFNLFVTVRKLPPAAAAAMPPCVGILALPITFTGEGWPADSWVFIELVVPPGVEIPGLEPGADSVGIAMGKTDSEGRLEALMETTAKLNFLLRGAWTPYFTPDLTKAAPLPAGTYTIKAFGTDRRTVATTTWELGLVSPAK
ncbi:MAG: hypothetical protein FJZ94_06345 [Chloroflexi bacterium]|nr:hypothetical protein [Chloroflexota bacterium]